MSALNLFKAILTEGWPLLEKWKTDKQHEHLYLEFKKREGSTHEFTKHFKGKIAKALSAFANTEGGVLVIGISCKRNQEGIDTVDDIAPIENIDQFHTLITGHMHDLTMPPVVTDSRIIRDPENGNRGVIAIYVQKSDGGPHMAVPQPDVNGRFFIRSGSNSVLMPYGLLGAMFGRRPTSKLGLIVHYSLSELLFTLEVRIVNSGRGYAERPAIIFRNHRDPTRPTSTNDIDWHMLQPAAGWNRVILPAGGADGTSSIVRSQAETVLYPGMEMVIGYAMREFQIRRTDSFVLSIHGTMYAMNAPPARFELIKKYPIGPDVMSPRKGREQIPILSPDDESILPEDGESQDG